MNKHDQTDRLSIDKPTKKELSYIRKHKYYIKNRERLLLENKQNYEKEKIKKEQDPAYKELRRAYNLKIQHKWLKKSANRKLHNLRNKACYHRNKDKDKDKDKLPVS